MRKHPSKTKSTFPPEVAELAERLQQWRKTRIPGQRIPRELWKAAGGLARVHGISPISRALALHHYDLRRHALPQESGTAKAAAFVELAAGAAASAAQPWTLEVRQSCGSQLNLQLANPTAPSVRRNFILPIGFL